MAKQRSRGFHDTFVRRIKKQADKWWLPSMKETYMKTGMRSPSAADVFPPEKLSHPFLQSCQMDFAQEVAMGSAARLDFNFKENITLYLGLISSWITMPKQVSLDRSLQLSDLDENLLGSLEMQHLMRLFPGCCLLDVRHLNLEYASTRGKLTKLEGVFVYPSYSRELESFMLLFVGLGKDGFIHPVEGKLTCKGETLKEMLDFSFEDIAQAKAACRIATFSTRKTYKRFNVTEDDIQSAIEIIPFHAETMSDAFLADMAKLIAWICSDEVELYCETYKDIQNINVLKREQLSADEFDETPSGNSQQPEHTSIQPPIILSWSPICVNGCKRELNDAKVEEAHKLLEIAQAEKLRAENSLKALQDQIAKLEAEKATLTYNLKSFQDTAEKLRLENEALLMRASFIDALTLPDTPLEALEMAEKAYPERLVVLNKAKISAKEFTKGDVSEVWNILRAMAVVLHPMLFTEEDPHPSESFQNMTGFEVTLRDVKQQNKNAKYDKLRKVSYKGKMRDITPHVKGRSVKKGETLRVHFYADHENKLLVIGHCGEHMRSYLTSSL